MKTLLPALGLALSFSAHSSPISLTEGLLRPESAYIHDNALYISNQAGGGMVRDGIGWIQKLNLDGTIIEEQWVSGLNAPKGLRSDGKNLYTADIYELVIIDLKTKAVEKVKIEGAILLNDVVVESSGNILVSDTWGEKIYRVNPESKSVELMMNVEEAPNGLFISGNTLYIGGYGKPNASRNGLEAGTRGSLRAVDLTSGEQRIVVKDMGQIDGIEETKEGILLVTVKGAQSLNWVEPKEGKVLGSISGVSPLASFTDIADLAFDKETGTAYIPNTNSQNVQILKGL